MTAPLFSPMTGWAAGDKLKNWAGNLEYSTEKLDQAKSVTDVSGLVKKYPKLKGAGNETLFQQDC